MESCTNKYFFFLLLFPHSKRRLFPNETCNKYYLVRKPEYLESETFFLISSDIVILILNIYLVFSSCFWHKAPKTFDISCAESEKDIFCYVNEMTFRNYLKMGAGCQGEVELSILPTASWEERWAGDWVQSPVSNHLINPAHVRKPP